MSCLGTDAFVQNFVAKKCRATIDDVEKLDAIQDGFIHYQLLRFCQATRLQFSHIVLGSRCVLQQQHFTQQAITQFDWHGCTLYP